MSKFEANFDLGQTFEGANHGMQRRKDMALRGHVHSAAHGTELDYILSYVRFPQYQFHCHFSNLLVD